MFYVIVLHFKLILSSRHVTMTIYCFRIDSLIYSALHLRTKQASLLICPELLSVEFGWEYSFLSDESVL